MVGKAARVYSVNQKVLQEALQSLMKIMLQLADKDSLVKFREQIDSHLAKKDIKL